MENNNKIVPCIWVTAEAGQISSVIEYYKKAFNKYFEEGYITALGRTPSGNSETCQVAIFGRKYTLICTEYQHQQLTESVSFMINCDNQKEIDHYWDYFTKEGKESQCGWCLDRYGLSWQIIPNNFGQLLTRPGASKIMMKQKKIVISDYK